MALIIPGVSGTIGTEWPKQEVQALPCPPERSSRTFRKYGVYVLAISCQRITAQSLTRGGS